MCYNAKNNALTWSRGEKDNEYFLQVPSPDLSNDIGHLVTTLDNLLGVREGGVCLLDILGLLHVLDTAHDPGVITVSLLCSLKIKVTGCWS